MTERCPPSGLAAHVVLPQLAAGFGISTAAAWRYVHETLEVLASWAPGLQKALVGMGEGDFVMVDFTAGVLPRDPGPHPRPHRGPRLPRPTPPSEPVTTTTVNNPSTSSPTETTPTSEPGERAFAQFKTWRLRRRARCSTRRIETAVQAVHTPLTCSIWDEDGSLYRICHDL
jgi:hypothetical protein